MTDPVEPRLGSHVSHGLKLSHVDWGNEGAPPLLLIHGMCDHARSWDHIARALRHDWHVIAPDLRGHGDSAWSPDGAYLAAFHLHDLTELIDSLGHGKVTIVAHSFGGNVSARYAALFPDRVRKLALVDGLGPSAKVLGEWAAAGPIKRTREWIEKRREVDTRPPRRFATIDEAVARMAGVHTHLSPDQAQHLAQHGVRNYADGYGWKYDPLLATFLPEDFAVELKNFWPHVKMPTLLCWGTESWTSNPHADGREKLFPNARTVVFEKASHWIHHDQPERFLKILREFLAEP